MKTIESMVTKYGASGFMEGMLADYLLAHKGDDNNKVITAILLTERIMKEYEKNGCSFEVKPEIAETNIRIGREVRITYKGCLYSTYRDFFREHHLEHFAEKFVDNASPDTTKTYTVLYVGTHSLDKRAQVAIIRETNDVNGQVYLMDVEGLGLVED